jgi:arsenite methyltransferase
MGEDVRERVKERYAGAALTVLKGTGTASCCGSAGERGLDSEALGVDWTGGGYSVEELGALPEAAGAASLGCGNPTALATLSPGEVVLDLGSGGGIDVLLSAKRVSPGGKAYGLDMTDEMLALAEKNRAEAGAENVEFLKGHIEEIPLPEDHVDVVISNCVINLSTDKPKVISEAFRVLKAGGRFAVSDMVFLGDKGRLPAELVMSMEAWSGCVSGALERDEYERASRTSRWRSPTPTRKSSPRPPVAVAARAAAATPRRPRRLPRLRRFLWPAPSSGVASRPGGYREHQRTRGR